MDPSTATKFPLKILSPWLTTSTFSTLPSSLKPSSSDATIRSPARHVTIEIFPHFETYCLLSLKVLPIQHVDECDEKHVCVTKHQNVNHVAVVACEGYAAKPA